MGNMYPGSFSVDRSRILIEAPFVVAVERQSPGHLLSLLQTRHLSQCIKCKLNAILGRGSSFVSAELLLTIQK